MRQTDRTVEDEVGRTAEQQAILATHRLALGTVDHNGFHTTFRKILELQRNRKRGTTTPSEPYCFTQPYVLVAGQLRLLSVRQQVLLEVQTSLLESSEDSRLADHSDVVNGDHWVLQTLVGSALSR